MSHMNKTGIYIAFPTSSELKSIYRAGNYRTQVNSEHTKVGITERSFKSRSKSYADNFDNEVEFEPFVLMKKSDLKFIEEKLLLDIQKEFLRVGRAKEWFDTNDHDRIKEIVIETITTEGKEFELIPN